MTDVNTDVNTDANMDVNTDVNADVNTDVNTHVNNSIQDRPPLRPSESLGEMADYFRDHYMNAKSGEITDTHLKDIEDTFKLLDQDNDGRLSKDELAKLLRYTGTLKSDKELEDLLEPIDTDHNGSIDLQEFKAFIIEKDFLKELADEVNYEMQDAFNVFDKNGDGYIDKEELRVVLTKLGDKMPDDLADEFLREADLNGDGMIDYAEFAKHMGY